MGAAQSFLAGSAIGKEFKGKRVERAREAKRQEFQDMFGGKEVDRKVLKDWTMKHAGDPHSLKMASDIIALDEGFRGLDASEKEAALRQISNAGNMVGQVTNYLQSLPPEGRQAAFQEYMASTTGDKPELASFATEVTKIMGNDFSDEALESKLALAFGGEMFADVQKNKMKQELIDRQAKHRGAEQENIADRQADKLAADAEEAKKTRAYKTEEEAKSRKGKTELAELKSKLRVDEAKLKRGGLSDRVRKETIGKMIATALTNKADMEPEDFERVAKLAMDELGIDLTQGPQEPNEAQKETVGMLRKFFSGDE